jgi:hypothetical protein
VRAGDELVPALLNLEKIKARDVTVQVFISHDRVEELSQDIGLTPAKLDTFLKRIGKDRVAEAEGLDSALDSLADEYNRMKETLQRFQTVDLALGQLPPFEILETVANKRTRRPDSRLMLGARFRVSYEDTARRFVDFYWTSLTDLEKSSRIKVLRPNRKAIEADIARQIYEGLAIDLIDVIVATWKRDQVLQESAVQSKATGTTLLVSLADHETGACFDYPIRLQSGDNSASFNLEITTVIHLKGLVVRLENGRAKQIQSGYCEGLCRIEAQGQLLFSQQLGRVELSKVVDLGKGIPLV